MNSHSILIWLPEDLRPSPGTFDGGLSGGLNLLRTTHGRLVEAVNEAMAHEGQRKCERLLPWIKLGTGRGAAFFGIQEIVALSQAPLAP